MKTLAVCFLTVVALAATKAAQDPSQDPSIDRLLGKLPPPEKFVDPAINDPLAKHMAAAAKAHNFGIVLDDARRLAERYPKSVNAQFNHGSIAFGLHMYPESSGAFRKVLAVRPDFALGYVGLGLTELAQQHYRAAMGNFQQVARLLPNKDIGWLGLSVCADKLGQKKDALTNARKATAVAPNSTIAWLQAGHEESLAGNKQAAAMDLARANQLHKAAAKPAKKT
jgi:tetratricopeptide (TPR) repeat protein